jgi:hypothetical protein
VDSKTTRRNITEDPNFNADCRHNHERDVDGSVYRLRASVCVCVCMCGFCNVLVCVCMGFVMCGVFF